MAYPISVIQLHIDHAHPEDNLASALALTQAAIARGAKLVLLPEACISDIYNGVEARAERIPGPVTEAFAKIAGNATIALPLLETIPNEGVFSACAFLNRDGVVGESRKTHLYYDASGFNLFRDANIMRAGNKLEVIEADGVRFGVALGFDAEFPETFRTLALKNADIILVALNCVEPDLSFLSSMALRNRTPIAVANRIGFKPVYPAAPEHTASAQALVQTTRGDFLVRCKGGSAIIGADGKIEAQPKAHLLNEATDAAIPERVKIPQGHFQEEEILTASFVIEDLRIQKLTHAYLTARRPELYEK